MGKSALGRSKTVPRSSWFGPFFVLSFGIAFLVVLGSSWGRFWSSWAPLRVVFGRSGGRFGAFSAFQLIDSTHQLINSSLQLSNSSIQLNEEHQKYHAVCGTLPVVVSCSLTHLLNNSSTPDPSALSNPGPADCSLRD